MKLISLALSGYRQFYDESTLEFDSGLTGICGENGVGKSKLVEAIGFALYGPSRPPLPKWESRRDLPTKFSQASRAKPKVTLVVELAGQEYTIVRTAATASMSIAGENEPLAETPTTVTRKIVELLHLTSAAYHGTFVARQREVAGLQSAGPKDR